MATCGNAMEVVAGGAYKKGIYLNKWAGEGCLKKWEHLLGWWDTGQGDTR